MSAPLDAAPEVTVVTGGGGWFGRAYLANVTAGRTPALRRDGALRVLVGDPAEVEPVLAAAPHAQVHVGDVADAEVVARLFAGTSGASVVHAAAVIHPPRVAEFERVNLGGTRTVLDAAARARARRLVHVSSNSPFGFNPTPDDAFREHEPYRPHLGYGWSKMRAELAVREAHKAGLDTVVVRPPWFYGPRQPLRQTTFFTLVRRGRFPVVGDGTQRRSMVDVDDLAAAVALAERVAAASGRAFWVADAEPQPLSGILAAVREALAAEGLEVTDRAPRVPRAVGRAAQAADARLQARGLYQEKVHVLGELGETIACDVTAAREVLGHRPADDLVPGMRRAVRWCLDAGVRL